MPANGVDFNEDWVAWARRMVSDALLEAEYFAKSGNTNRAKKLCEAIVSEESYIV